MIVRLSKSEHKTLTALDPEAKGSRTWMTARAITATVFRKKVENVEAEEIRTVRNAFRKLVREELVEMGAVENRGEYRIGERGRKILVSEETEFESTYERGSATLASKEAGEKRKNAWEKAIAKNEKKAPAKKAAAPKKAAASKAKVKAKAPAKKAAPKVKEAKAAPAKKPETKVDAPKQEKKEAKGNGAPRTFQRKAPPPTVAEKQAEA